MEPLDLRKRPPRGPREKLGDLELYMLARTVDKLRATLPGGDLGLYQIPGFTTRVFQALGITEDEARDAVARAASDDEMAAWFAARADRSKFAEYNEKMEALRVADRIDDPQWHKRYPDGHQYPRDMKMLDLIEADDAKLFPKPSSV